MSNKAARTPPRWYWVVAVLALLWTLFGVFAWSMDLATDETTLPQLSDAERQLYAARPLWLFVVYAVAIFSGLAGAIGLLMRRSWATTALGLSLIAVVVQFGYTFVGLHAIELLGAAPALTLPCVIFAIGALLLWFSIAARQRGWLGG